MALVEQKAFRVKLLAAFGVGQFLIHHQKSVGQIGLGRCRKCKAVGCGRQVATRDAVQRGARTFAAQPELAVRVYANAPSLQCGEIRRLG